MSGEVAADAGPLIALARIDALGILQQLVGRVLVPSEVVRELRLDEGRPGSARLRQAVRSGWLREVEVGDGKELESLLGLVDRGEAEVIALAQRRQLRFVLIDERRGRQLARRRKIPVVGTGGLLLTARERGIVEAVAPLLSGLEQAGYRLSAALRTAILERAGEADPLPPDPSGSRL